MQRVRVRNFALPVVMAVHRIGGCSERPVNSPDSFRPDLMGRHVLCSYFVYGFCLPVVVFPAQDCQLGHPTSRAGFFFCRSPMQPPLVGTTHLRRAIACSWKATAMETEDWNRMLRVLRC